MLDGKMARSLTPPEYGRFLGDLVALVGMAVIHGPVAKQDYAWVVLAESHAMLHVQGDVAFLDVFSCKMFDQETVIRAAVERLGLTDACWRLLQRGEVTA